LKKHFHSKTQVQHEWHYSHQVPKTAQTATLAYWFAVYLWSAGNTRH